MFNFMFKSVSKDAENYQEKYPNHQSLLMTGLEWPQLPQLGLKGNELKP
jgi:hypothetical protein